MTRPTPLSPRVSAQMARVPVAGTSCEMDLRRALHRRGLRYRVNVRGLPGRPDITFSRVKLAVFVDGCFWHACPRHYIPPKNNGLWWAEKMAANRERDQRNVRELRELGWTVIRVWEHADPDGTAAFVEWVYRSKLALLGPATGGAVRGAG